MEKYRFDLQLFAEEAPAQAQPEATEQPEGQEPAQEQGAGDKKYTDKDVDAIINKKFAKWKAEQEGKPTWRSAIRLDIRESVQESYSWSQFLKEMEKRGYTWKLNRKYVALKAPGM